MRDQEDVIRELRSELQALQRRVRRTDRVGVGLAVLVVCLLASGMARSGEQVLEVEKLIVRDSQGRPRITLGTFPAPHDAAFLLLEDCSGVTRAYLDARDDNSNGHASVGLCDPEGRSLITQEVTTNRLGSRARLVLYGQASKAECVLGSDEEGAHLALYNTASGRTLILDNRSTTAGLTIGAGPGGPIASLGMTEARGMLLLTGWQKTIGPPVRVEGGGYVFAVAGRAEAEVSVPLKETDPRPPMLRVKDPKKGQECTLPAAAGNQP